MTKKTKSPRRPPPSNLLLGVGFCAGPDDERVLLDAGVPKKIIWMRGRGAESVDEAIKYLRGRPGVLVIANDLRIFGASQKEILARTGQLHKANIGIVNLAFPADENNPHLMTLRALKALHATSGTKDRRKARRRGRQGGTAKGIAAAAARAAADPHGLIQLIAWHPEIPDRIKREILKPVCGLTTAKRRYPKPI